MEEEKEKVEVEIENEVKQEQSIRFLTILEKLKLARRSKIKKFVFVIFMLAAVTLAVFFTFQSFGFQFFGQDAGAPTMRGTIGVLIVIFVVIYLVQSLTLNLIPGTTTFFITIMAVGLFRETLGVPLTFVISVSAVLLSSIPLYFLGRFGGRKLLFWLFGRAAVEKRLDWVARNGSKGLPWLFLIPFMTTDLLCVISGASKIKFWHYMLIVIVFRPVEVAMLVFLWPLIGEGLGTIDPLVLFLLINLLIVNLFLLIIYHRALLNVFNKTIKWRKLEDLAATQVAIMEAAELETQVALAKAEEQEREENEKKFLLAELKRLRKEINELKRLDNNKLKK